MFKSKKIKNQNSIGEILQQARSKTGLSLKMVAKHTGINQKYLAALENDAWPKLPGEVYTKNFLKKYCQFLSRELGINPREIKVDFNKISSFNQPNNSHEFKKKTNRWNFLNLPKVLRVVLITIITLVVLFYISWQVNQITQPPEIILFHPVSDLTVSKSSLTIIGQTEAEVNLKINHENVILDTDNNFKQTLNLQPGLNTIIIEGKKKYSKTRVIERKVVYESF